MSTDLAVRTSTVQITTMDELARVADMFAKSGMFQDARDAAQAGVKIMAGQAWGIDPFSAMTAIHLIQGRPTISAGVMAAKVKGHPKYDFRVRRLDNEACEIEFFQGTDSLGVSAFTLEDAKAAGYASKSNWKATPRNMLFARALSNGVRWFTPDVFAASVYTPEDFDEDGEALEVQSRPVDPAPERPALRASVGDLGEPDAEAVEEPEGMFPPDPPAGVLDDPEPAPVAGDVTPSQLKALGAAMRKWHLDDREMARSFMGWLFGREIHSSKELSKGEASRIIGWTADQWSEALADYAVFAAGGPPEDEEVAA